MSKTSKFLKWLDNYWYHYKWPTLIITFSVIIVAVLSVQLFSKEGYDAYIMYVGDETIPDTQYQDILNSFETVSKDYDGDKEIKINFSKMAFVSDEESELASGINASTIEYLGSLVVQPYYIYLLSPDVYELYKDSDVFVPITEVVKDVPSDWYFDDTAVYFDKTDFANSFAGVDDLGEDTLLVFKIMPYSSSKSITNAERTAYNNHLDMLTAILSYRKQ